MSNFATSISRRAALGRIAAVGGAFMASGLVPKMFAQTTPVPDFLIQMRKTLGAIPPVKTKLTEQVSLISGPGGNIAVFTWPEGKLAIDSSVAPAADAVLREIDTLGQQPLRILINTHWHFDHTDGNEAFHKRGTLIVAHENVRKRMSAPQDIDFFHARVPASPPAALPDSSFGSTMELDLGNEQVRIAHVDPAHTDTDSIIQFVNANVVHAGDILFSQSYPFIDYSTGGVIMGMVEAAGRVLALTDSSTKIIAGHGQVADAALVRQYRDMLADIAQRVQTLKRQGMDRDAVIAAKPTQQYDEQWAKGSLKPDQFAALAFSSL